MSTRQDPEQIEALAETFPGSRSPSPRSSDGGLAPGATEVETRPAF